MIIPSIDLQNGNAVQLRGGKELVIDAGDPFAIAERFRLAGEIAVVDLDAAIGTGSNAEIMERLCSVADCRVGGGIRDVDSAIRWLDAGAAAVVLGTAAKPDVLRELPRTRVVAALDAVDGEVVIEGWKTKTGRTVEDEIASLAEHCGGFLLTFVEREGRKVGIDAERVAKLVEAAGPDVRITIAGGVTTPDDIAVLDRLGCEAQVGMALYDGTLPLADAVVAPITSDRRDGLWPTVVTDERGVALGLAYSNLESVRAAVESKAGVYHSRSRGGLWRKGETSGATQELLRIDADCDRDALRFTVRQAGAGFCHLATDTCWGDERGLGKLARTIRTRVSEAPAGSYTKRLLADPALLRAKLTEEAGELADAVARDDIAWEAADVLYFTLVAMARGEVDLSEVETQLRRRAMKVTRRKGDAKPGAIGGGA
ncbi:MAG: phosphoribosyl-ATP diphosphatase [Planctomycetota bacterium]